MPELEASVRDLISRYVAELISIRDLSEGLPDGWDVDQAGDPDTAELVMRVVGYLAEYERGTRSESQLREALRPEASWKLEHSFDAINPPRSSSPVGTRVLSGAGTPPQVVHAS